MPRSPHAPRAKLILSPIQEREGCSDVPRANDERQPTTAHAKHWDQDTAVPSDWYDRSTYQSPLPGVVIAHQ